MPAPDDPIGDVIAGLVTRFETVTDLERVLGYEPTEAPALPLLTIMFRGFARAGLETNLVRDAIKDPLMGRRWVWLFWVRLWIQLNDAEASQTKLTGLVPQVVRALEADRSLGGVAVDAALTSGDTAIIRPQGGNPMVMLTCECSVETEEPLT